jgi:hypothetical protein
MLVRPSSEQHAEAAMNHPETDEAKPELASAERDGRNRRGAWVGGTVVAGVATVAIAAWAIGQSSGDQSDGSAAAARARPERVAAAFVDAYAGYDRPRLKSLLAGNALANWPSTRDDNVADEAIEFRVLLDSCTAMDHSNVGTRVSCDFDVHALGSKQLGRGPYSDNTFVLNVRNGKIITANIIFNYDNNGFAREMWEPFVGWVTKHYPKDAPAMFESPDPRPEGRSAKLFHQHIADYVAAKSS